jgi:hypothetical protein
MWITGTCSARGAPQKLADLVERRLHIGQRQLAVGVFALRVDHHDGRFRQRRRCAARARHLQQGLWFSHVFPLTR